MICKHGVEEHSLIFSFLESVIDPMISSSNLDTQRRLLPSIPDMVQHNEESSNSAVIDESPQVASPIEGLIRPSPNQSPEVGNRKVETEFARQEFAKYTKHVFASIKKKKGKVQATAIEDGKNLPMISTPLMVVASDSMINTFGNVVSGHNPRCENMAENDNSPATISSLSVESSPNSPSKPPRNQVLADIVERSTTPPNKDDEQSIVKYMANIFKKLTQAYNSNLPIRQFISYEWKAFLNDISSNEDAPRIFLNKISEALPEFKEKINEDEQQLFIKRCTEFRHQHAESFSKFLKRVYSDLISDSNSTLPSMPTIDFQVERKTVESPFKSPPIPPAIKSPITNRTVHTQRKSSEELKTIKHNSIKKVSPSSIQEKNSMQPQSDTTSTSAPKQRASKCKKQSVRTKKLNASRYHEKTSIRTKSNTKSSSSLKRRALKRKNQHQQAQTGNSTPIAPQKELTKLNTHSNHVKFDLRPSENTFIAKYKSDESVHTTSNSDVSFFHPNKRPISFDIFQF